MFHVIQEYCSRQGLRMLLRQLFVTTLGLHGISTSIAQNTNTCTPSLTEFKWSSQLVRSGAANLRVIVQGYGPTVLILPSYGRDSGNDFNYFSSSLARAGYLVLRPQPRGTLGSTGLMANITLDDLAADVANVIDCSRWRYSNCHRSRVWSAHSEDGSYKLSRENTSDCRSSWPDSRWISITC